MQLKFTVCFYLIRSLNKLIFCFKKKAQFSGNYFIVWTLKVKFNSVEIFLH